MQSAEAPRREKPAVHVGTPSRHSRAEVAGLAYSLLASLAACEADGIVTHASLMGLEIAGLEIEATGHFDLRSYLGVEGAPGSGYEEVTIWGAPARFGCDARTARLPAGAVRAVLPGRGHPGASVPVMLELEIS